jgi:hypothetical protein
VRAEVTKPTIICLTPVKNEAWILDKFLSCASLWADHIIVADQGSDDGSREIAQSFPKVTVIDNASREFNEPERQRLLLDAARSFPGPRLLIALDADEFFSANWHETIDWELMLRAPAGTVVKFKWACVLSDKKSYYIFPADFPLGYMDDGAPHEGRAIHSPRLPLPQGAPVVLVNGFRVLHFSTIDFERFKSKIRWYQLHEFLQAKGSLDLYKLNRWYHRDFEVSPRMIRPLPRAWLDGPGAYGELVDVVGEKYYRWDIEVIDLLCRYGPKAFSKVGIWDTDWDQLYERIFEKPPPRDLSDPRSWAEQGIHRWLERTRKFHSHLPVPQTRWGRVGERVVRKMASFLGW